MTLFELDRAELELLQSIEAVYEAAAETGADPGAEAQALIDRHLEALGQIQEELGPKLVGYVKAMRAKRAKAAMLEAEMALYGAPHCLDRKSANLRWTAGDPLWPETV